MANSRLYGPLTQRQQHMMKLMLGELCLDIWHGFGASARRLTDDDATALYQLALRQ